MKHLLALSISITLFICSCSNSNSDKPNIRIISVYIEGDDTNYNNKLDRIPELTTGDKIDFYLTLDGNGNDIRTFMVQNEFDEYLTTNIDYKEDEISDGFSEPTDGQLIFVDNVKVTTLNVEAVVKSISDEEISLTFILFSKASDGEDTIEISLKTGIRETPETEENEE